MYHRIYCAYDGTPGAGPALDTAVRLAQEQGATLRVVIVQEPPRQFGLVPDETAINQEVEAHYADRARATAAQVLAARGCPADLTLCAGRPAECILHCLRTDPGDLLVVGHSGHPEWWTRLFGSTVEKVLCGAPCPVLVVCAAAPAPAYV